MKVRSRRAVPLKQERVSLDVYLLARHALDALNDDDVERAKSNLELALRRAEANEFPTGNRSEINP